MGNNKISIEVSNGVEFNHVMKFMEAKGWVHENGNSTHGYTWDPPHPGTIIALHDGFYIYDHDHVLIDYDILPFTHFAFLTGIHVPEKPKEIILKWGNDNFGGTCEVGIRNAGMIFKFNHRVNEFIVNRQNLTEILTALKSLEDE